MVVILVGGNVLILMQTMISVSCCRLGLEISVTIGLRLSCDPKFGG